MRYQVGSVILKDFVLVVVVSGRSGGDVGLAVSGIDDVFVGEGFAVDDLVVLHASGEGVFSWYAVPEMSLSGGRVGVDEAGG